MTHETITATLGRGRIRLLASLRLDDAHVRVEGGAWVPLDDLEAHLRGRGFRGWKARELADHARTLVAAHQRTAAAEARVLEARRRRYGG